MPEDDQRNEKMWKCCVKLAQERLGACKMQRFPCRERMPTGGAGGEAKL